MRILTSIFIVCLVWPLAQPAAASDAIDTTREIAAAVFTEVEKRVIRDYYRQRHAGSAGHKNGKPKKSKQGLPPGLAKKDRLPPGLQKQLQRNGRLPPGLAKRDLPADLVYRLPHRSLRYERVIADSRVLLVERASGVIADIISDLILDE
jgi:hypothetical protein